MMGFIVFYVVVSIFTFLVGHVNMYYERDQRARRVEAWMQLTCFLWPIWVVIGLWYGVRNLLRVALGK